MVYPLKPIFKQPKYQKFLVLDVETQDWKDFVFGCVHNGKEYYFSDTIEGLIDICFKFGAKHVFSHNGGKFDFLFILQYRLDLIRKKVFKNKYIITNIIDQGSRILSFVIYEKGKDKEFITFHDSVALLKMKLRDLCICFNVETKKGFIDYNYIYDIYNNINYTNKINKDSFKIYYENKEVNRILKTHDLSKITYINHDDNNNNNNKEIHRIYSKEDLLDYCQSDCAALHQVLTKFYSWDKIIESGQAFTIGSQAMKIFRTFITDKIYPLSKDDFEDNRYDTFCRGSYYGGRTEIIRPVYVSKNLDMDCYDGNSLYPHVLKKFDYPLRVLGKTKEIRDDDLGIYDVTVTVPRDCYFPPLPTFFNFGHNKKLIFPTGSFRGKYCTPEIKLLLEYGGKIDEVHDGLIFENGGKIFETFVDEIYTRRQKAKEKIVDDREKGKPLDYNAVFEEFNCKTILNSLYGKFGTSINKSIICFGDDLNISERLNLEPFYSELLENDFNYNDYFNDGLLTRKELIDSESGKISYDYYFNLYRVPSSEKLFSHVAIASFATSYARCEMYRYWFEASKDRQLYYLDTDSLYTTKKFKTNASELGELKHEYSLFSGIFLRPKTYGLNLFEKFEMKMKGVTKNSRKGFDFEDFITAFSGNVSLLKAELSSEGLMSFKEALRRQKDVLSLKKKGFKEIKSYYDKRRLVDKNGSPLDYDNDTKKLTMDDFTEIDSEPWHVENEKIINITLEESKRLNISNSVCVFE